MQYTDLKHCSFKSGKEKRSSQNGENLKGMKAVSFNRNRIMPKINGHIAEAADGFRLSVFNKRDILKKLQ